MMITIVKIIILLRNNNMKILWLLLISVSATCPPRKSTMECFYNVADTNSDGFVTKEELSNAISKALHWYEKIPFQVFGGITAILNDCDANHDNVLSVEESMQMRPCMDTCFKRRHTVDHFHCK